MRSVRFPRKYFPVAVIPVLGVTFNWLRPTEWGAKFLSGEHVAWIAAVFIAFAAGMLYADLLNTNSDLRQWWRYRSRLFDVVSVKRYPRDDAQGRHEHVTLCIRFVRRVRDASICMRVGVPGWSLPKSLDLLTNLSKAKDAELTLVVAVAHIMKRPVVSGLTGEKSHDTNVAISWGNPEQLSAEHYLPMGGPCQGFATIVIETNDRLFNRQAFAIYAETFADSPYFITDEDHDLLVPPVA